MINGLEIFVYLFKFFLLEVIFFKSAKTVFFILLGRFLISLILISFVGLSLDNISILLKAISLFPQSGSPSFF
jgi:hypothetical protein